MRVKNWEKFQHYHKGRGTPPWIKLYRDLLNDKEWFCLDPAASKFLVSCWLLAAENDGELPDSNTIAFRLRLASKEVEKYLKACSHWIISDASNVLAERYQVAIPETETETEEEEKSMSSSQANVDHASSGIVLANGKAKFQKDAEGILAFLNETTGSHFRPVVANLTLIAERLKEGASIPDCRRVIILKSREWSGSDMAKYLRPATLFNRTKFAQYVAEEAK